jgi:DNA-binding MarR family transcriptional regulator
VHIGRLIKVLNTSIENYMNRQMAEFDLTASQGILLGYLDRNLARQICQKDLEIEFNLSHPTICSILKRMEAKGLIVTEALLTDKRFKRILITDKGVTLHKQIHTRIDELEERMRAGLTDRDQDDLLRLLDKVAKNISS